VLFVSNEALASEAVTSCVALLREAAYEVTEGEAKMAESLLRDGSVFDVVLLEARPARRAFPAPTRSPSREGRHKSARAAVPDGPSFASPGLTRMLTLPPRAHRPPTFSQPKAFPTRCVTWWNPQLSFVRARPRGQPFRDFPRHPVSFILLTRAPRPRRPVLAPLVEPNVLMKAIEARPSPP
jgi:hypothetical protein